MTAARKQLVSIVVPVYNEAPGIAAFHESLRSALDDISNYRFEIIYIEDGSRDNTYVSLWKLAQEDTEVRVIRFTRNFGKEVATTAGLEAAKGAAIISMDGDGQHPPELIHLFLEAWEHGSKVIVGQRKDDTFTGIL